jgi:molybdopterin biosynthesis enzyme
MFDESRYQVGVLSKKNLRYTLFYRDIGDDVNIGELVLEKNVILGPAELGLLATVGLQKIRVYDKPHVVVLSTGNEVSFIGNKYFYI